MKPSPIEAIQMTHESLPTVAATAPIENSTSGGTPLATQNAPVQSMPRSSPATALGAAATTVSSTALIWRGPLAQYRTGTAHALRAELTGSMRPRPKIFLEA